MPKKPDQACLSAVKTLTDYHDGNCATYYSSKDDCAVIVVRDPELSQRIITLLGLLLEEEDEPFGEIEGVPLLIPADPIEA